MRSFSLLLAAFGVLSVGASGQSTAGAGPNKLDKPALEQYVRHLFVWGPQVAVKVSDAKPSSLAGFNEVTVVASAGQASQEEVFLVSADGRKLIRGVVYDVTQDPFAGDAAKVKTDLQPSFGTPGAPVVIVMYSDFQCSYCREEAKAVRQNVASLYPNEVRVYFKDFPLEAIHPWAKPAAIAGRCVFRQNPGSFWAYHDWIFEHQGEITPENLNEKVREFAKSKGVEPIQFAACLDKKATEPEVNRSVAEGKSLQITSTPTMFVNGRRVVGQVPWPNLKQIIDHEIEYAKTHGAGEKCCEVTVPSGLKP